MQTSIAAQIDMNAAALASSAPVRLRLPKLSLGSGASEQPQGILARLADRIAAIMPTEREPAPPPVVRRQHAEPSRRVERHERLRAFFD